MARISRRQFIKLSLLAAGGAAIGGCRQLLPPGLDPSAGPVSITILHVNDVHGALYPRSEEGGEVGGVANLVGLIERKRDAAPGAVLLLDAGDAFQGTFVSNSSRGQAMVEVMNLAGVDAFALGNHEFDWGVETLQARMGQASFPVLAANLETDAGATPEGVSPYVILQAGDVRVGVLGMTYHDLQTIVRASAIEGLRSTPPVEAVRRYLPEVKEQSDLAIVLSHLGFEGDQALARAVPEIPLIVGGHSHGAPRGGYQVGDTTLAYAGANGQYLGEVVLQFDPRRKLVMSLEARAIRVTDAGTPNGDVEALVETWGDQVQAIGSQVVGEAAAPLNAARGVETALGNLITDAMRAADLGDGKAFDIALHNDGGIRADVDAGPITYAELYAVLPFDNSLVGVDLTGAQVKEMLEDGISDQGSEIQVSGLSFAYTVNKAPGRRVMEVLVGGQPLDPGRTYRVVTIDYLYSHPLYEDSLGQGEEVFYGGLCLDAVVDYVRTHSPVRPRLEQRIRRM
jgi:2',3'-cyclic-nucleotide 2'-phosphodiesterase (5'-nucleotidase family)